MVRDLFVVLFGSVTFAYFLLTVFPEPEPATIISPLVKTVEEVKGVIVGYPKTDLSEVVEKSLTGTRGTYAIVIKNLRTGEIYTRNETRIFEPASLYKLWVMGTVYKQVKAGTLI
jgi:hypothetical protein